MKTKSRLLFAFALSLFLSGAMMGQWNVQIFATDGFHGAVLVLGTAVGATVGIDPSLGEEELPEPFTSYMGTFSARCLGNHLTELGNGSLLDFLPYNSTSQTDTFLILVMPSYESFAEHTIVLLWPANIGMIGGGYWHIIDLLTGADLLDMTKTTNFVYDFDDHQFLEIVNGDGAKYTTFTYDRFYSDVNAKSFAHGKPNKRSVKWPFSLPNIHNVGEDLVNILKPFQTNLAQVGSSATKSVLLKDYASLLKSAYTKAGAMHTSGNYSCLDSLRPVGKSPVFIKRLLKALPNDGKNQNNYFFAQLMTLKFNMMISGKVAPPVTPTAEYPLLGDLIIKDGSLADGMTISGFAAQCDAVISCGAHTATFAELTAELSALNGAFYSSGPIDTLPIAEGGMGWNFDPNQHNLKSPPVGSLKIAGWKAIATASVKLQRAASAGAPINTPAMLDAKPGQFRLDQNYPNPFNPTTKITFNLVNDGLVSVKVFNMLGQEVSTLADREEMFAGANELTFDASSLASGAYFYRITVHDIASGKVMFQDVKKMMLVK